MIITICYGKTEKFNTREDAIESFMKAIDGCDPSSSECSRYIRIVSKLRAGADVATDAEF